MVNLEPLKTVAGLINLIQVILGFGALFASSFIWTHTNVFFQFIYEGYGWQTLILFILFVTWLFALAILFSNLFGKDVISTVGKNRLLIMYAVVLGALVISAALESWYAKLSGTHKYYLHARFVIVTIFNWMLVISYIALIAFTALFA